MQPPYKRELWIDVVKGIAILAVVLQHSLQRTIHYFDANNNFALSVANLFVNSVNMQWFFVISGLIYFLKRETYLANPKQFIKTRFYDLMIPYLIFGPLIWLGKFILSAYVKNNVEIDDLIGMFVTPIAFLWFIYVLFFVEVIIYMIDKLVKPRYELALLFTFVLYVIVHLESGSRGEDVLRSTLYFCFWYYLGGVFVLYKDRISNNIRQIICAGLVLWITLFIISVIVEEFSNGHNIIVYSLRILYTLGAVAFVLLFSKEFTEQGLLTRWLNYLGINTMYLYILNPIIINGTREVLVVCNIQNMYINMVLFFINAVMLACLIAEVAKRVPLIEFSFSPRKYLIKK